MTREEAIEIIRKEYNYEMAIKALSQEPCDDVVSRDAVLDAVSEGCQELRGVYGRCEELINALPSVTPSKEWVRNIHDKEICPYCGKERWSKDV